jgi:DNA-binding transcriptional ArsR family regulator
MTRPPDKAARRQWADFHGKLYNREAAALYSTAFTAVQLRMVLYLFAQTRGTGRIDAGEDIGGIYEWEDARETFGRPSAPLYCRSIAKALDVTDSTVRHELRNLERAGVVVVEERGHKGKKQVLSLNLDPSTWQPLPRRSVCNSAPNTSVDNSAETAAAAENCVQQSTDGRRCSTQKTPDTVRSCAHRLREETLKTPFGSKTLESTSDPSSLLPPQQTSSKEPTVCQRIGCGAPLPAKNGPGQPRRYCCDRCQRSAEKKRRRDRDRAGKAAAAAERSPLQTRQARGNRWQRVTPRR